MVKRVKIITELLSEEEIPPSLSPSLGAFLSWSIVIATSLLLRGTSPQGL